MIATKTLQKRLFLLEQRPKTEPDLVEMVLAALADADLEVLLEASELNAAGYTAEEISSMMGERWLTYEVAAAHFQECYAQSAKASECEHERNGL